MNKIVSFKAPGESGYTPLSKPDSLTRAERILGEVRALNLNSGSNRKLMAARVGVSTSTLYNINNGKTKWPRPTTLFPLVDALGMELQLVPKRRR